MSGHQDSDHEGAPVERKVVAVRTAPCADPAKPPHSVALKLESGHVLSEANAVELIEAGGTVYMELSREAPNYGRVAAQARAQGVNPQQGLRMLLQVRECPHCLRKVLFA